MIKKTLRLNLSDTRNSILLRRGTGNFYCSSFFNVYWRDKKTSLIVDPKLSQIENINSGVLGKVAVIVPKKKYPLAVERNFWRRTIYDLASKNFDFSKVEVILLLRKKILMQNCS